MRPRRVSDKLAKVEDWPGRAIGARYHARQLARTLAVDLKSLQRFFRERFGKSVQKQLEVFRQTRAEKLALNGEQAKAIAYALYFKKVSHFSRHFRMAHGVSFRMWLKTARTSPTAKIRVLSLIDNSSPLRNHRIS